MRSKKIQIIIAIIIILLIIILGYRFSLKKSIKKIIDDSTVLINSGNILTTLKYVSKDYKDSNGYDYLSIETKLKQNAEYFKDIQIYIPRMRIHNIRISSVKCDVIAVINLKNKDLNNPKKFEQISIDFIKETDGWKVKSIERGYLKNR